MNMKWYAGVASLALVMLNWSPALALESEVETVSGAIASINVTGEPEADAGVSLKYWGENLGVEGSFSLGKLEIDAEGTDLTDELSYGFGGRLLLGVDFGRAKPHVGIGIDFVKAEDDVSDLDLDAVALDISVGIDVLASDRVVVGVQLVGVGFILSGNVSSSGGKVDVGGNAVSLVPGGSVGVRF